MAFAPGALVFAGGRIEERDRSLSSDDPRDDSAARVAAVRETLEETGIAVGILPPPAPKLCRELQQALLADADFGDLLRTNGLTLDPEALTPFARWVPKFHAVRRFDTHFFVAPLAQLAAEPHPAGGECVAAFWISATQALERESRGEGRMIFPTRRTLERLALHSSYESIQADALAHPVEPITPWAEWIGDEEYIMIPEGLGYPVTREKLDGLWRG